MSAAQIADVIARTHSLDVSAALTSAIATGKRVRCEAGSYKLSSTVTPTKGIIGDGQYDTKFYPAAGVNASTLGASGPSQGGEIEHIFIGGNGSTGNGIVLGSSSANYVADWRLFKSVITGFTGVGGAGNQSRIMPTVHQEDCGLYTN